MEDLDFVTPPAKPTFDTRVALKYFKASGSPLNLASGDTIFVEKEKNGLLSFRRDKMYFLVEGEVELTANNSRVGTVNGGEIFGEMTLITDMPRTASATARTDCRLYTLDRDQLHSALGAAPEFGLLLMSIMITRLRDTISRLETNGAFSPGKGQEDSGIFDTRLLRTLEDELDESARIPYTAKKVIMSEGQAGVLMFVVLEGSVDIVIHGNVVATIGPGGMFGEMALITRGERVASAYAKTDCILLAINRNVFLDLVGANPKFAVALLGAVGNRARFMASQQI